MRTRSIFVSVVATALLVTPAFATSMLGSTAGAKGDCTITGTAARDILRGTTREDVVCTRAGSDIGAGMGGNDVVKGGQGDDIVEGDEGSDIVKGQADDDDVCGNDQNDRLYGGQGDDNMGGDSSPNDCFIGYQDASPGANSEYETGNDFLKSRDNVSGNDDGDGGENTDTCVIDAQDDVSNCEQ
jgi:RTX calcium-binding nonapeptide repeat (4 copies)